MTGGQERPWAPESATYDQLFDVIRHRRMVYSYEDGEVTDEDVEAILDAGRWAPSAHNTQPWEFIVLREGDEKMAELTELVKESRNRTKELDDNLPAHGRVHFEQAPVAIVVVGDWRNLRYFPDLWGWYPNENEFKVGLFYESIGCCMQNMHLAAKARGLGTTHNSVNKKYGAKITDLLDIPDYMVVLNVLPVGVAGEHAGQDMDREPLESLVHYGTYDQDRIVTEAEFKAELDDHHKRVERMHGT